MYTFIWGITVIEKARRKTEEILLAIGIRSPPTLMDVKPESSLLAESESSIMSMLRLRGGDWSRTSTEFRDDLSVFSLVRLAGVPGPGGGTRWKEADSDRRFSSIPRVHYFCCVRVRKHTNKSSCMLVSQLVFEALYLVITVYNVADVPRLDERPPREVGGVAPDAGFGLAAAVSRGLGRGRVPEGG